jgi:hypothetical protein
MKNEKRMMKNEKKIVFLQAFKKQIYSLKN